MRGRRSTRSGAVFSPWASGQPILPAAPFHAAEAIQATLEQQDGGYGSDEDAAAPSSFEEHAAKATPPPNVGTPRPAPENPPPPPLTKTQKDNARYRKKRGAWRDEQADSNGGLKGIAIKKRKLSAMDPVSVKATYSEMKPSEVGWMGKAEKGKKDAPRMCGLDELVEERGFRYIEWAGETSHPLADSEGATIGAICAPPKDGNWAKVNADAAEKIEQARCELENVPEKFLNHQRGKFPALPVGMSHGGGQKVPGNLRQNKNEDVLANVLQDENVKRIAMLADHYFQCYAPDLHKDYNEALDALSQWSPNIRRNYPGNAFAAASVNFGPRTVSIPHYDFANLAWGLCAVSALGSYDPDKGGHMVLWDLRLVIRFPPGSVVIIPSAIIKHSNTPIANHECRYSIAQYSASGLFRFIDNGFMTDDAWFKQATMAQKEEREAKRRERWETGLARLSKLSDLCS